MVVSTSLDFPLDPFSVEKIIGRSKEVMVYGFRHAYYSLVHDFLKKAGTKVFDCSVGDPDRKRVTNIGRRMRPIVVYPDSGDNKFFGRMFKAGITNLVFENYKRARCRLEIIPLIFCVESSDADPQFKLNSENLATRDEEINKLFTYKELRRAYKLCKEFEKSLDLRMRKMAAVAKKTIRMVSVDKNPTTQKYEINEIAPVWVSPGWKDSWAERMKKHEGTTHSKDVQDAGWRKNLRDAIYRFEAKSAHRVRDRHKGIRR